MNSTAPARAHHRSRVARSVLIGGVLAIVAGCAPSGSDDAGSSSGTLDRTAAEDGPCAWAIRGDRETNNIAYPDTAATYWALSYDLVAGETIELQSRFPAARYASFISYGPYGSAVDVLADRDIEPDAGNDNPFADGPAREEASNREDGEHGYTVVISPDHTPDQSDEAGDHPNILAARPEPGSDAATRVAPSTTVGPDGSPAPDPSDTNRLGTGAGTGTAGTVIYRVYMAEDESDPTGGTGLPDVTVVHPDGSRQDVPTCPSPGRSERALELVETYGPPTDREAPPQPIFVRPDAGAANLFPNPDNVYIATIAAHEPGRIVVIQGTAPTFPDPTEGRPVGSGEQLRYWSLCTNEYRVPYPVSFCVLDRDVVLDDDRQYTVVVSTPEDRPDNATEADGVTWLDWGSTEVDNLLLLRHMLADPGFAESATNLEPGAPATSMGIYAPVGTYCSREDFEQHGPEGCAP